MSKQYNTLILITPKDFTRLCHLYPYMLKYLPVKRLWFVGSKELEPLVDAWREKFGISKEAAGWLDEDSLVPFDAVRDIIRDIFPGAEVARGFVGWYYQQFLKMSYALHTKDEYYLVWDGDTIPVRPIAMQAPDGVAYFDTKTEYYEPYFISMRALFSGMDKCIQPSFISEHMLIKSEYMREMLQVLTENPALLGTSFYERILRGIGNPRLNEASFSEFETFGTFVVKKYPESYRLRKWMSFRNAGQYFDPNTITESDIMWLGKDFSAISFEKGHTVEPGAEFFQNKEYQAKLSAAQILAIVQEEMTEGYREDL